MKFFEMGMILCFGLSWPVSLYKSIRSRSTGGKSLLFLCFILIGYLSGLVYKISAGFDFVSWFYLLNTAMVAADIGFFLRNRRWERRHTEAR